jgi:CheY-like chemotaxis protein
VFADPEKSPRPHVVLLDLRLPRIDGLEVLREIRTSAVLEKLPVVILTTSEAEIDADRAYAHHANSFLVKPLDFDKFVRLMEDLGFYWLKWNYYPWA